MPPAPAPSQALPVALSDIAIVELDVLQDAPPFGSPDLRRSSRDPQHIAALTEVLQRATWSPGSLGREMPTIELHLRPPSAEGGTYIAAFSEESARVVGDDQSVWQLDTRSSKAIWTAARALRDAPTGYNPPTALIEALDGVWIVFHLGTPPDRGLVYLNLDGPRVMREADAVRADGTPLGLSRPLDVAALRGVLDALEAVAFFSTAKRFHAPAVTAPGPPPKQSEAGPPPATRDPHIVVTVRSGDWHRTWVQTFESARFADLVAWVRRRNTNHAAVGDALHQLTR